MNKQKKSFSIVIPTYNRSTSLAKLLDGCLAQQYPGSLFEIIVVDDGSTDNTPVFMKKLENKSLDKIRYFRQSNKGPAAARNLGVKKSLGQLILFLDDDVVPAPNVLEAHMELQSNNRTISQGIVLPASETHLIDQDGWSSRFPANTMYGQHNEFGAVTANLCLHKSDFLSVKGFDETLRVFEDTCLAFKLFKRFGMIVQLNTKAKVFHTKKAPLSNFIHYSWISGIEFIKFVKKYPAIFHPRYSRQYRLLYNSWLQNSVNFKPWTETFTKSIFTEIGELEKQLQESPNNHAKRRLTKLYHDVLKHSFHEGSFQAIHGTTTKGPELLLLSHQ